MGVFSRVKRGVGKVVSVAGGPRLVDRVRTMKHKLNAIRGNDETFEDDEVLPPWPDVLSSMWERGHDLLTSEWPATGNLMVSRFSQVGATIEGDFSPLWPEGSKAMAGAWIEEGQVFTQVWLKSGEALAGAWEVAIKAPTVVEAEGILDSAVQDQWRYIREHYTPLRLAFRRDLQAAGKALGLSDAESRALIAPVDSVWGVTETQLSDRFLGGGGYLVSLVREAARGQAPPGELIDIIQDFCAQLEKVWRESLDSFEKGWRGSALYLKEHKQ